MPSVVCEGRGPCCLDMKTEEIAEPRINVRAPGATAAAGPLLRRLTGSRIVPNAYKDGHDWLRWTWEPEPRDDGRLDCGYSGIRDDHADYEAALVLFFLA